MTRGKVLVGVRKRSGPFVTMITPYMVDVVTSCQQIFVFLKALSHWLAMTSLFLLNRLFLLHTVSQQPTSMQNEGLQRIALFRKPFALLVAPLETWDFPKRDRELHFEFGNSLCWNIRLHVLKRTCIGGGLVWDSCSHAFSFGFSPTVFTFLFRVKLLS